MKTKISNLQNSITGPTQETVSIRVTSSRVYIARFMQSCDGWSYSLTAAIPYLVWDRCRHNFTDQRGDIQFGAISKYAESFDCTIRRPGGHLDYRHTLKPGQWPVIWSNN